MNDWKKSDKQYYLPKQLPQLVVVPKMKFFTVTGQGNPNSPMFAEKVGILYALSYAVKMSPKRDDAPKDYEEYQIYPLEGVWDLTEKGRQSYTGKIDKDELAFKIMIRQPDFVDDAYAKKIIDFVVAKKGFAPEGISFEAITEGECVQMLHVGSFDTEPASFALMESFATKEGYKRLYKTHREIYLSDPRKVAAEKLKTVLRFQAERAI
jgi:hypothetical protein